MVETVGERVHQVRRALGPNARRAMSQDAFAELLTRRGARRYYGPEISLIESGKKPLSLEDAATIMSVDPLNRTIEWLHGGIPFAEEAETPVETPAETPLATAIPVPNAVASALSRSRKAATEAEPTRPAEPARKVAGGRAGGRTGGPRAPKRPKGPQ